jgi:hypothetical protein
MNSFVLNFAILDWYEGDRDQEDRPHGAGHAVFRTGYEYDGQFSHGLLDGNGVLGFPDGTRYSGDFVNNCLTGSGRFDYSDGSYYDGQVVDGVRHGRGVFYVAAQKLKYEGEFENGKRHGSGSIVWLGTDARYEGGFANDAFHGRGCMTYKSGNVYEGAWEQGIKVGQGRMFWCVANEEYVGAWESNLPHGDGEYRWLSSGNRYVGSFVSGMRDGEGVFYYADGSQYVGSWRQNQKDGHGTVVDPNGTVKRGLFVQDRLAATEDTIKRVQSTSSGAIAIQMRVSDIAAPQMEEHGISEEAIHGRVLDSITRHIIPLRSVFAANRHPDGDFILMQTFWHVVHRYMPSVRSVVPLAQIDRIFLSAVLTSPFAHVSSTSGTQRQMHFRDFCEALVRVSQAYGVAQGQFALTENVESLLSEFEQMFVATGASNQPAGSEEESSNVADVFAKFSSDEWASMHRIFMLLVNRRRGAEGLTKARALRSVSSPHLLPALRHSTDVHKKSSNVPPQVMSHPAEGESDVVSEDATMQKRIAELEGRMSSLENGSGAAVEDGHEEQHEGAQSSAVDDASLASTSNVDVDQEEVITVRELLQLLQHQGVVNNSTLRLTDVLEMFPGEVVTVHRELVFAEFLNTVVRCAERRGAATSDLVHQLVDGPLHVVHG